MSTSTDELIQEYISTNFRWHCQLTSDDEVVWCDFRPTMIKYGIHNIRDLFGPKINLHKVYTNPLCRLEK